MHGKKENRMTELSSDNRLERRSFSRYEADVKIHTIGNHEIVIDGCKGVLEYSSTLIRLNLKNQQLKLSGRNLLIRNLEKNSAQIDGYIGSIEFV